ncbi:MAG: M23 family metallopeptidase [Pseudomonadota bacterium]
MISFSLRRGHLTKRFVWQIIGLIAVLAAASCASKPPNVFIDPVPSGKVTSTYGFRSSGFHHGIDLAAPRGTEVRAAKAGKVIYRGRRKGFGRLVIIDHGRGEHTYYAHLSSYTTRKGRSVKRGQRIGRVGKSGRASGHHLHFEIRQNGKSVNPQTYISF